MLNKFKAKIQDLMASQARMANRLGLTPNSITITGLILALLAAFVFSISKGQSLLILFALIFLMISGFCDALDGVLARIYKKTTVFGGFLDSLFDRYADAVVYSGIIIGSLCNPIAGLAALFGSLMVSYTRAKAESIGIKMEGVGWAERPERLVILMAATLIAIFWLPALSLGIILLAIVSNFTVVQRIIHVNTKLKKEK